MVFLRSRAGIVCSCDLGGAFYSEILQNLQLRVRGVVKYVKYE